MNIPKTLAFDDITVWVSGTKKPQSLADEISAVEGVASERLQPMVLSGYTMNGHRSDNEGQLMGLRHRIHIRTAQGYFPLARHGENRVAHDIHSREICTCFFRFVHQKWPYDHYKPNVWKIQGARKRFYSGKSTLKAGQKRTIMENSGAMSAQFLRIFPIICPFSAKVEKSSFSTLHFWQKINRKLHHFSFFPIAKHPCALYHIDNE